MIYFTADVHLGHKKILDLCGRPFDSVEAMDRAILDNWNSRVTDEDTVYILGDLIFRGAQNPLWYLSRLKGKKVLIRGNHDEDWMAHVPNAAYEPYFACITPYMELTLNGLGPVTLCHYPLLEWNYARKYGSDALGYLIYGHIHNRTEELFRPLLMLGHAFNAGMDVNDFRPVTPAELMENNERFKLASLPSVDDRARYLCHSRYLYREWRGGRPIYQCCEAVALEFTDPILRAVAFLRDAPSTTDLTVDRIRALLGAEVAEALAVLAPRPDEDGQARRLRIKAHPVADAVEEAYERHGAAGTEPPTRSHGAL